MFATVTLIAPWINFTKNCKDNIAVEKFKRDIPAKYNLLFSNIPYAIRISYK